MKKSPDDLLERANKMARKITWQEMVDRGFAALEDAGLERGDIQRLADDVGVTGEDIAYSLSPSLGFGACMGEGSTRNHGILPNALDTINSKIEEIRDLLVQQRDSQLQKEWYTVVEAASLTGFKPYTIRQCCNLGESEMTGNPKIFGQGSGDLTLRPSGGFRITAYRQLAEEDIHELPLVAWE